jgi:copper(I)-binding protein
LNRKWLIIFVAGLFSLAAAAQQESGLVLENAWVRALPPSQPNTAAYLTLVNRGDTAVGIVSASSEIARKVEMHTTRMIDGYMRMEQLHKLALAAGERVEFVPGGAHLMLLGLTFMPEPGDLVQLCVKLLTGEEVCTEAETHKASPDSPAQDHSHH